MYDNLVILICRWFRVRCITLPLSTVRKSIASSIIIFSRRWFLSYRRFVQSKIEKTKIKNTYNLLLFKAGLQFLYSVTNGALSIIYPA